jgi:multiple sugar transport system ATP-binding protein
MHGSPAPLVNSLFDSPAMNFTTTGLVRDDGHAVTFAGYKLPVPASILSGRPGLDG